jgi:hypothetical protein
VGTGFPADGNSDADEDRQQVDLPQLRRRHTQHRPRVCAESEGSMIERPILFSAPMVQAILDGTKTQTRRIIKPEPETHHQISPLDCRYGVPGDRLWVRETFAFIDNSDFDAESYYEYRADTDGKCFAGDWPGDEADNPNRPKWKPSIHMPRRASRITLHITGTRPERLQDISPGDAHAEAPPQCTYRRDTLDGEETVVMYQRDAFRVLWEKINGARSWDANPLVWVIQFKRVKP